MDTADKGCTIGLTVKSNVGRHCSKEETVLVKLTDKKEY